ncbi:MAG: hypothetical protein J0H46_04605 [Bacteroidetes bacterium]|nr:hypothetical protein [Bacteroidota bacterium]
MKNRVPLFIIIVILIAWNISLQVSLHNAEDNITRIKSSIEALTDQLQLEHDNHNKLRVRVEQDEDDIDTRLNAIKAGGSTGRTNKRHNGLFH